MYGICDHIRYIPPLPLPGRTNLRPFGLLKKGCNHMPRKGNIPVECSSSIRIDIEINECCELSLQAELGERDIFSLLCFYT